MLLRPQRAALFPLAWLVLAPLARLVVYLAWHSTALARFDSYDFLMMGSLIALWEGQGWFEAALKKLPGILPAACAFFLLIISVGSQHWAFFHPGIACFQLTVEADLAAASIAVILLWLVRTWIPG